MVVRKEDIHRLVERLNEHDQKSAFDFLQYLIECSNRKASGWEEIGELEPDDEPLTEEELRQLNSDAGYVTGEEAKRGFGVQTDLP